MRRLVAVLPLLALLGACANPNVPDFMVEGRLPEFGDRKAPEKPEPAPQKPTQVAAVPAPAQKAPQTAPQPASRAPETTPEPAPKPPEKAPKRPLFGKPKREKAPAPMPMAGGFGSVTDKATINAVTAFAMGQAPNGYLLKGVKSVKSQVVAGTNFELCLRVRTPGHESSWIRQRLVKAVVWQKLDQTMELTSWNEVEECE